MTSEDTLGEFQGAKDPSMGLNSPEDGEELGLGEGELSVNNVNDAGGDGNKEDEEVPEERAFLDALELVQSAEESFRKVIAGSSGARDAMLALTDRLHALLGKPMEGLLRSYMEAEKLVWDHQKRLEHLKSEISVRREALEVEMVNAKVSLVEAQSEVMNLRFELGALRKVLESPDITSHRMVADAKLALEAATKRVETASVLEQDIDRRLAERGEILRLAKEKRCRLQQRVDDLEGNW
mmetsp:Transcript_9447/g.19366  ORF Transcript_9447/g.19366 Transcript_9447/m.19366 type:complete len:239 (-) Transcript_9447:25-741(-)|eukprot:CAMPEP_0184688536 /NCGR_PEP_ID=MMETSP0312-20130426/30151_1 /TAXON_ID=31354 /ORGANISM="Compsopogon coeruleus, Strain SAG 36.94" /LENGTH=238 /DNA_ID=CAMNT_0027145783 /DNA_START=149 /DNA_END=865 /DNA_ORIENTATION=+